MGINKCVNSSPFSIDGRDWNISLYPDGWNDEDKASYVSANLNLLSGPVGVKVKFSLSLLGKSDREEKLVKGQTYTFDRIIGYGWAKFMEKSKLKPLSASSAHN
ncbi:hypothetical protein EJB05_53683, partial [Eragrostis curvula]